MMNQNERCGCNRCGTQNSAERINVGGCDANRRSCGYPRPCPHPCRPNPCERRCEQRAREIYLNQVERAREEFRCNMKHCRRHNGCGHGDWNDFNDVELNEEYGCNR